MSAAERRLLKAIANGIRYLISDVPEPDKLGVEIGGELGNAILDVDAEAAARKELTETLRQRTAGS